MCGKVTEIKAEEPEETPDEEITQPDTEPETGKDAQIEEESKNAVTEIFEAITSFFKNIFVNNYF